MSTLMDLGSMGIVWVLQRKSEMHVAETARYAI